MEISLLILVIIMLPVSTEGRKAIDTALVKMIALDLQPSSITEDRGFQNFVKILDPKYIPPSRRTIMRDLFPPFYEASTQELARLLAECDSCAITTDLWTSCTTTGFLTVTCHFFTKLWKLRSYVLDTVHIDVSHTAENIAAALVAAARKWDIMDKISCAVTDNANNIVAAIRIAGWSHLPCFAHTINLIVTNAISEVPELEELIKSCKDIVSYFHKSSKATDKLQSIQTRMNIPNHKLIQQVDTRWNSVFYMIELMVEQDEAVRTTLCLLNRNDIIITSESIDVLKSVIEVLRPFEAVTREMSADKYLYFKNHPFE